MCNTLQHKPYNLNDNDYKAKLRVQDLVQTSVHIPNPSEVMGFVNNTFFF